MNKHVQGTINIAFLKTIFAPTNSQNLVCTGLMTNRLQDTMEPRKSVILTACCTHEIRPEYPLIIKSAKNLNVYFCRNRLQR